jgi:hypothetical protein
VNGTIAAVAQAYQEADGRIRVSFLAPEEAFKPGANDVQVYSISSPEMLVALQTNLTD